MRRLCPILACLAACAAPPPAALDPDLVAAPSGLVVASLQRAAYDARRHDDTCKVFHHVFAPDGRLLTKGLGGEFPHHRGLFVGWNRMQCAGQGYDFWHCRAGESQQFRGLADGAASGLGAGWQQAEIDWVAGNGTVLLHERRAARARTIDADTTQLDIAIELRAAGRPVRLDGDPQHSGHQFRALQQFADPGAPPLRYVRPAAAEGRANDVWVGCEWIAAVLPMPGGPVTVLRIEGRDNPKPATWSTRPYGRFGATLSREVRADEPLRLRYRYVMALGERDAAACERLAAALAD